MLCLHFKKPRSIDQKKIPMKSVKEMESEVYLNFFEKLSPRINFANENRLNSLLKMLSQLFTTIL